MCVDLCLITKTNTKHPHPPQDALHKHRNFIATISETSQLSAKIGAVRNAQTTSQLKCKNRCLAEFLDESVKVEGHLLRRVLK